ncbi:MAG: hypothetical protein ABSF71_04310 [Terriglobia bacterium]|jgi:ABC-type dipeptide/oligopeptide/nickel transport system permease subunit
MADPPIAPDSEAAKFMLREYDRIVDAYHNLHDQKNELLKFYLAFTTLPFAIVAISSTFIGLAGVEKQTVLKSLQVASVFLSVLLEMVGISVLMTMLKIRWEQYLYVKTINAARSYFHEVYGIPDKYLVLPHKSGEITFGQNDVHGRVFWEGMIVGSTNSMLLALIAWSWTDHFAWHRECVWLAASVVLCLSLCVHAMVIRIQIKKALRSSGVQDVGSPR